MAKKLNNKNAADLWHKIDSEGFGYYFGGSYSNGEEFKKYPKLYKAVKNYQLATEKLEIALEEAGVTEKNAVKFGEE
jgi:YHS domain-containing protein